jgi:hypothetical protein
VTQLKSLAASVKAAVGAGVKVMYGGDWSEYHSSNGWYHLDPLWSDSNIDVVAIDCYFPLTPDLPQTQIDYQAVYDGWTQDEGWDYYYADSVNRTGLTSYGGSPLTHGRTSSTGGTAPTPTPMPRHGMDGEDEAGVVFGAWLSLGGWLRQPAQRVR